jgi:hypothetical protein
LLTFLTGVKRTCRFAPHMSAFDPERRERLTFGSMEGLGRVQGTDGDVVPVKISERKLCGSSAGIHVWLFFQPANKSAWCCLRRSDVGVRDCSSAFERTQALNSRGLLSLNNPAPMVPTIASCARSAAGARPTLSALHSSGKHSSAARV